MEVVKLAFAYCQVDVSGLELLQVEDPYLRHVHVVELLALQLRLFPVESQDPQADHSSF